MDDLKPCPFCGGNAELVVETDSLYKASFRALCEKCKNTTQKASTAAKATRRWNRRSTDQIMQWLDVRIATYRHKKGIIGSTKQAVFLQCKAYLQKLIK